MDIVFGEYDKIVICLVFDLEYLREIWVEDFFFYIILVYFSLKGDKVIVIVRGWFFIVFFEVGRIIFFIEEEAVIRYCDVVFFYDGVYIIFLFDESGELEFV